MNRSLFAAVIFALVTVALFLVRATPIGSTAPIIPMLLAGMTAMAAILSLQQWSLEGKTSGSISVTFDETLSLQLDRLEPPKVTASELNGAREQEAPWQLTARQLIGVDTALALARLRLDLEQLLRQIAYRYEITLNRQESSLGAMARRLMARDLINPTVHGALQDIARVCNAAIHGKPVSNTTAREVVRVGEELIAYLTASEETPTTRDASVPDQDAAGA